MNGEMFVEELGGLWECGSVIKLDLVTIRPDAPPPGKVLVCRLVIPRDDLRRIATSILETVVASEDLNDDNSRPRPITPAQRDEIVVARTE